MSALWGCLIGLVRRQTATIVILVGILTYVVLAGADASIVRAGVMGLVVWTGKLFGRKPWSVALLLVTMALMLVDNPFLLRDDVGFQLSFAATAGLLTLEPRMSVLIRFLPAWGGIRESLSTSLAAIVATLPVILFTFGEVSLIAPVTNLLVLPFIPLLFGWGVLMLALSFIALPLALVLSAPLVGILHLVFLVVDALSSLPIAFFHTGQKTFFQWVFSLASLWLLRAVFTRVQSPAREHGGSAPSWKWMVFSVVFALFPITAHVFQNGFYVTFLSIGQGDATYIKMPSGDDWLVDGGPDETVLYKLGQELSWFDRTIETMVLTHADADHITGLLDVASRYRVDRLVVSDPRPRSDLFRQLKPLVGEIVVVHAGADFSEGGVSVSVVGPPAGFDPEDRNDLSVVLDVEYDGVRVLLTGDAAHNEERVMESRLRDVDVLKVGHHGSRTSTSERFLKITRPEVAIISSGLDNRYGHPHGIVLRHLSSVGALIYRTDQDEDVRLTIKKGRAQITPHVLLL